MSTQKTPRALQIVALTEIHLPKGGRPILEEDVERLASSIARLGQLVPALICPRASGGYTLIAGRNRYAACKKLERPLLALVREGEDAHAATAVENIVRKQLTPLEEAEAVARVLAGGYGVKDAAQALGWSEKLVSARAKILELPENAQRLIGEGVIPLGAIDALLAVNNVCPPLAQALAQAVADGELGGHQLANNMRYALMRACESLEGRTFVAFLDRAEGHDVATLKLGKKAQDLYAEAERLHSELSPGYVYGGPTFAFNELEVGQARAAGVLIEIDDAPPLIAERSLYRELCKQAIARGTEELRARAAERRQEKSSAAECPRTAVQEAESEHRSTMRELARRAQNTNLDLGAALMKKLHAVRPTDMNVARFFVYGLLGRGADGFAYGGETHALSIAASGLRLVLERHRTTTTPTLKSGKPGKTKVAYSEPETAEAWLWGFLGAAKSAGELYARALIAYAAHQYAIQLVVPGSQRRHSALPASHKDTARKAFEALTKDLLPGTHRELSRAIASEARAHQRRLSRAYEAERSARQAKASEEK